MSFEELERIRISYYQKKKKGLTISAAIIIISLILVVPIIVQVKNTHYTFPLFALPILMTSLIFSIAISLIITALITKNEATAYRKAYKAYFVSTSLAQTFTNLKYNHDSGLDAKFLSATGMINLGDRYHSDDLVVANYKNVNFIQADAHIEEEYEDSDGDKHYSTIFRGRFMFFEFPKKFDFRLEVIGCCFSAYHIPGSNAKSFKKIEKIETESTEFNKRFTVYAEDGLEAFYILDPAYIEKIQAIGEKYNYEIILGFIDNKLLVGINNGKDSFEPPSCSSPIDEKAELAKVSEDIKIITELVDQLKLSKKLFQN